MFTIKSIKELNTIHLDVLKEIGSIGSGNAITALSKLLNTKIGMEVPNIQIVDFKKSTTILGGAENIVVGILLAISGDINGYIMFIFEQKDARSLLNVLFDKRASGNQEFTEMEVSALSEIGNILAGSYLSSLCKMTGLNIKTSTPALTIDMAGAILSVPAIEFGKTGDLILFIETKLKQSEYMAVGNFLLIPDVKSYNILLKSLGVAN